MVVERPVIKVVQKVVEKKVDVIITNEKIKIVEKVVEVNATRVVVEIVDKEVEVIHKV